MRARPAGPDRAAAPAGGTFAGRRRAVGAFARHFRQIALWVGLIVLLAPPALLLIYRFVPVPITPLMLIRLAQGEGLAKDWVPLGRIAPALAESVVASEDNQFCAHWGFDWAALEGEAKAYLAGEHARGASTISQQTAKNLFLWPDRSVLRKLFEAPLTLELELLWPKRRIIEVYLNVIELGPGVYGAEAAARRYFARPAAKLSRREAALLAAVLPNPRKSSPARPSRYLESRVRTIETRIEQLGPMLECVRPS
jgi:monofunctional biosynthetic peptidoglycan transglycosylase